MSEGAKKDIQNEDVSVRSGFVKNLSKTAESLGPDRFRDEIIPELKDLLDDEEDVTSPLAEELGKPSIEAQIGGSNHLHLLFPLLEALSKLEDTLVRDKAVASLSYLATRLPAETFEKTFVELVHRLGEADWFPPKSSACGLIHVAFPKASPAWQQKLLAVFKKCCEDPTPMVRRSAASSIKKLAPLMDKSSLPSLIEDFKILSGDDQDSVRLLAVENCVAISHVLTETIKFYNSDSTNTHLAEEEKNTIVKPVVLACGNDKSWRVRYMVASTLTQLADALGQHITQTDLVPIFVQLLKDTEAEVRSATASKVSGVSKLLSKETLIKDILPCIKSLSTDDSSAVRSALASDVMGLSPIFGKDGTNEYLLELFLQLLKDETSDVRLNIISNLNQVTQVLGLDQLSQYLLPAIVELAEDRQWRIRSSILDHISSLAGQLGVEFFNDKLSILYMNWMNDCVFSIREAAAKNMKKLTQVFGVAWAKQRVIPKLKEQSKHPNYLYRTASFTMITALSEVFPASDIQSDLVPFLLLLGADRIPNIRITAARTLSTLIPLLEPAFVQKEVVPFINDKFLLDLDKDVAFFGNAALQMAKKRQ